VLIDRVKSVRTLPKGASETLLFADLFKHPYCSLKFQKDDFSGIEKSLFLALKKKTKGLPYVEEFGIRGKSHYVLTEWVHGVNASKLEFSIPIALQVLRGVVTALISLRKLGFSHGDLSPANVLVASTGEPVLIDMCLNGLGAVPYAAPERFEGRMASEKSDIYALGILLYRMITGKLPLENADYAAQEEFACNIDSFEASKSLLSLGTLDYSELFALESIWKGTLCADPEDRFEDLEELDENLEIALGKLSISAIDLQIKFESWLDLVRQKIDAEEKSILALPEQKIKENPFKKRARIAVCLTIWFIALVAFIAIALSANERSSVAETGSAMLKKSRSELVNDRNAPLDSGKISKETLEGLPKPE